MNTQTYSHDGGILDIIRAKLARDWTMLSRASFTRAALKADGFGIVVSPPRAGSAASRRARKENTLALTLLDCDLSYSWLLGYHQSAAGPEHGYGWHSLFLGTSSPALLQRYARQLRQPSFLFCGGGISDDVQLLDTASGDVIESFGTYEPDRLQDLHASLLKHSQAGDDAPSHPVAWEYIPTRNLSSMRAWDAAAKRVASETGVSLTEAKTEVEQILRAPFFLFEDDLFEAAGGELEEIDPSLIDAHC